MERGRPKKAQITLSEQEHADLQVLAHSRSLPHSVVRRAQMILMSAEGYSNTAIAEHFSLTLPSVGHWRKRYLSQGIAGLYDVARPGRPRSYDDDSIATLLNKVLKNKPKRATHWSTRLASEETGISKSTVQRYLHLFGVQPHRSKSFKLSTDPFFVEKVRDIVGLYLNPPDKALVLCVDEKSQIQAIERSQPAMPVGMGEVEGIAHDYFRHGTTTLFAALDVASGEVIGQCKARHRHQEFLSFLRHVDNSVPASLDVHLVIDNYATHKHPKVRAWLAQRPRYHVHYTPTYSSWLNQVERWFGLLTQRALKRNSFKTVTELTRKIDSFVEQYNAHSRPFVWTATADSILQKIERLCKVICGTPH